MRLSERFVNRASRAVSGTVIMLAGLLVAGTASAQQAGQQPAQPPQQAAPQGGQAQQAVWKKFCSENQQTKKQICAITRQTFAQTGQILAAATIQQTDEALKLMIAVPPAMLLRPGMKVEIDGASEKALTYSICIPNLCFADVDIDCLLYTSPSPRDA